MNIAKQAVLDADVVQQGHFVFADGAHATTKLEIDNLWEHSGELDTILDLLAEAQGLPPAQVILGVPEGGQRLAATLVTSGRLPVSIAMLERIPGGAKQDFRFATKADEKLAKEAHAIRIYEDVVTTLSSIAGVVRLLDPAKQEIHALAIWRRGNVKPEYRRAVTDHYLVEEPMVQFAPELCPYPGCRS